MLSFSVSYLVKGHGDLTKHFLFYLWRLYLWNAVKESFHICTNIHLDLSEHGFGRQRSTIKVIVASQSMFMFFLNMIS